jgi:hypothetical protein
MDKDSDAIMLETLGTAITQLQVKYRSCGLSDRMAMKPALDELTNDYGNYQLRLLKEGVICSNDDLKAMESIKGEIDNAAEAQELVGAIAKTIAFIAAKA